MYCSIFSVVYCSSSAGGLLASKYVVHLQLVYCIIFSVVYCSSSVGGLLASRYVVYSAGRMDCSSICSCYSSSAGGLQQLLSLLFIFSWWTAAASKPVVHLQLVYCSIFSVIYCSSSVGGLLASKYVVYSAGRMDCSSICSCYSSSAGGLQQLLSLCSSSAGGRRQHLSLLFIFSWCTAAASMYAVPLQLVVGGSL